MDITHKSEDFLQTRFPNLFNACLKYGINMATQPIPVVPAAHYSCGGIITNVKGETSLAGLPDKQVKLQAQVFMAQTDLQVIHY